MKRRRKFFYILLAISLIVGISLWLVTGKWISEGKTDKAFGENEYAIVLGAKVKHDGPSLTLRYRLETALDYANSYPHVKLILSGGQGSDEPMSEAAAMKKYLIEEGVAEERLVLEEDSTSTYENLFNSAKLLPDDTRALTIITSDFHVARAQMIARNLGLETDAVWAKTPKVVEAKSNARERIALLKTYIFGK